MAGGSIWQPFRSLVAGASTGLLLGVLVGLSALPVVATPFGALITLATAFLGFSASAVRDVSKTGTNRELQLRRLAVAALAMTCLLGVLAGLVLRARDAFAPPPPRISWLAGSKQDIRRITRVSWWRAMWRLRGIRPGLRRGRHLLGAARCCLPVPPRRAAPCRQVTTLRRPTYYVRLRRAATNGRRLHRS